VSKTLKEFETILASSGFMRVHHSHLINLRHVEKYIRGEGGYVLMRDGASVDISRNKKEEFLNRVFRV
jgi:two-component system LytT family response regulator